MGEISEIIRGASPRPISDPKWFNSNSNIGWLRISDVTAQHGRIQHLSQHISILGQAKTRVISTPHLLLSIAASVGYPVINYVKTGVHDGFLIFENPKFNIDFGFYWLAFYKHEWQKFGQPGSQVNLNSSIVKKTNIGLPDNVEQKAIVHLLKLIDNRITLQQRKLTELQLLRTSLNQQLLKDNSSWKSVKLREILNIRNKQIFPNQQYPLMSFVQKQGVVPKSQRYNRDFLVKGNKKYKVTEKGDFIYSSNNLETGSIGINKTGNATISPVYSVFSSKNYKESLFIGLLSEKKSFIYKMIRFRQGVVYGQWKIPEKDFLNIKIKIPNYQEQEKIITLFTHIDNQFKQENKKLTDLQNFKQFLLQNMFI